jgi:hypothetical protein
MAALQRWTMAYQPHALSNSTQLRMSAADLSAMTFYFPSHLLAHRVMLLAREQHARMDFAFRQVLRVKAEEVSTIEAIEDTITARSKLQMLVIRPLNHADFLRCDHIHPTRSERLY